MSNYIGDNINAIRIHFGFSQDQLAEASGVSQTTVSAWECGLSTPRKSNIQKLIDAIPGIQFDDILSEEQGFARKVNKVPRVFAPVPLYGSVAAGTPIEMIQIEDMKEAPAKFVDDDPNSFLVRVRGNSMNKRIQDTDFALVSPKYNDPNEHDMFLVAINGDDATIKKLHVLENGIELVPDSYDPTYRPKVFDFGDEGTPMIRIIGKVVWWCASF